MRINQRKLQQMVARIPCGIETKEGPDLELQIKTLRDEIVSSIGTHSEKSADEIQKIHQQLDALESKIAGRAATDPAVKSFDQQLSEDEGVSRLMRDRRGKAIVTFKGLTDFEKKTTITSSAVGSATSGVLNIERMPGVVPPARKRLFLGDLLTRIPTDFNAIDYIKVTQDVTRASPQVEASAKNENALTFTTAVANVRTIATFIRASRQILSDLPGLAIFIKESLRFAVKWEEEMQILFGSNVGESLNGLVPQSSVFNTALLGSAYQYADQIGRTILQLEEANEVEASFVVLPPRIWWDIRLQKDANGQYIYGNPATGDGAFNLFGLTPIRSNNMTAGTYLVGASAASSAVIRDREELNVEISTEDADNFTKNLVTLRAEERIALVVSRPASFIRGSFVSSP